MNPVCPSGNGMPGSWMSGEPGNLKSAYVLDPMKMALHGIEDKGG